MPKEVIQCGQIEEVVLEYSSRSRELFPFQHSDFLSSLSLPSVSSTEFYMENFSINDTDPLFLKLVLYFPKGVKEVLT